MKINEVIEKSEMELKVDQLQSDLLEKYNLSNLSLFMRNDDTLRINMISVDKSNQKQGIGSAVMQDIVNFADSNNLKISLTTGHRDDRHGTTSTARLIKFYKKFGFVENKGRNKDFSLSDNMYRNPK